MLDGKVKGFFVVGENPAVGSANAGLHRKALAELDWLVVRDLVEIETARFWHDSPEVERGELRTRGHRHRGVLPAGRGAHREGRHVHQHPAAAAVAPQGGRAAGRLPLGALVLLPPRPAHPREAGRLRATERDRPMLELHLGLPDRRARSTSRAPRPCCARSTAAARTARALSAYTELEGRRLDGVRLLDLLRLLRRTRRTRPARRKPRREQTLGRARVGLGLAGEPPHPLQPGLGRPRRPAVVGAQALRVVGRGRRARGPATTCPTSSPTSGPTTCRPTAPKAEDAIAGDEPFIMQADGAGWLFAPAGLVDGPLPTHYEPHESPFANPLYAQQSNPARQIFDAAGQPLPARRRRARRRRAIPYVITTYRLTEHHTAGGMSRFVAVARPSCSRRCSARSAPSWPPSAASSTAAGRRSSTARAAIEARVLVTERMRPLRVQGRHGPPGRPAVPLGLARPRRRATRPTTCSRSCSTPTCTSRRSRRRRATSAPAARPEGPLR